MEVGGYVGAGVSGAVGLVQRPTEAKTRYPCCLTGKRQCPPEDIGGVWGYMTFLEAIGDPDHPEHDEYLEWVEDAFDPEVFDVAAVNRELKQIR
jgi:hypothetical protein